MSFASLLIHTAVVTTNDYTGTTDDEGNPVYTQTERSYSCRIEPWRARSASEETTEGPFITTADFTGFFDPATELGASDHMTWEGRTLEVVGQPRPFYDSRGLHHYEVDLREVLLAPAGS